MAITIWSREKSDPSIIQALELEIGQYDFVFDSNILTRNTILHAAQMQKEPLQVGGKIVTVTKAVDQNNRITVSIDVKEGKLPEMGEAGIGKATIYAALGAIGILAIFYIVEIKKTGTLANLPKAIGSGLAEILLRPGLVIVIIFGLLVLIRSKAR